MPSSVRIIKEMGQEMAWLTLPGPYPRETPGLQQGQGPRTGLAGPI